MSSLINLNWLYIFNCNLTYQRNDSISSLINVFDKMEIAFYFSLLSEILLFYWCIKNVFWPTLLYLNIRLSLLLNSDTSILQKYQNHWAIITGSTDGIGKAYANELAKHKINVILISRNLSKLEDTAKEIEEKYGVKTKIIVADFSEPGLDIYKKIENELKDMPIGILVNNVATLYKDYPAFLEQIPGQTILEILRVNIFSVTMMSRIVLPLMKEQNFGTIVNVSSPTDQIPGPFYILYTASKAFMKNLSESLRYECTDTEIQIQHLIPMIVKTNLAKEFIKSLNMIGYIINPQTFAENAVTTLGHLEYTCGHWLHSITHFLTFNLPEFILIPLLVRRAKNYIYKRELDRSQEN